MKLLETDTVWAFLSGSDEDRFLSDISFGVACLQHRQLPEGNILLFVDQPSGANFLPAYGFPDAVEIHPTQKLPTVLTAKAPRKLVLVVTGHGKVNGISASPDIQPYKLLEIIKSIQGLETSLVVLGQCFAGTFNFLEAKRIDASGSILPPEVCLIGAADLTSSLSIAVDLSSVEVVNQFACQLQWNANFFIMHFMSQVANPVDYDGDTRFSVLDAYKAAGIATNQQLLELRRSVLKRFFEELLRATIVKLTQNTLAQRLAEKAREDWLAASDANLTHQTPWILHANLARRLEL